MVQQYVCLVCGFNMIGHHPDNCPFCNTSKENFISPVKCSESFVVRPGTIDKRVIRLTYVPLIGLKNYMSAGLYPEGFVYV